MLTREAANWLARLQSGREPDIERKFERWRNSDPRHAATFDRILRTYEQAGLLRYSATVRAVDHELPVHGRERRLRPALAVAAAAVLLLAVGASFLLSGRSPFAATEAVMLTTRVGEIKQVRLVDGSTLTLDTDTRVDVQISRSSRRAQVKYGRARFEVAEASGPFVVQIGNSAVETRDGVIDVERHALQGRFEVLSGAADVRPPDGAIAPHMSLGRGQSLTVASSGTERIEPARPAADWTRGMLEFDGTPLTDAVELANRYSRRHIVLEGNLGRLRVTGAFRAGDTAGLSDSIAAAFHLSLRQAEDGNFVLSPDAPSEGEKNNGG